MLILALLLLAPVQSQAAAAPLTPAEAMALHRQNWSANPQCTRARDENEIVVCSRRQADKYRVPLVEHGSIQNSDDQLDKFFASHDGHAPCGEGAFMVRCGSVGVGVRVNSRGTRFAARDLAP